MGFFRLKEGVACRILFLIDGLFKISCFLVALNLFFFNCSVAADLVRNSTLGDAKSTTVESEDYYTTSLPKELTTEAPFRTELIDEEVIKYTNIKLIGSEGFNEEFRDYCVANNMYNKCYINHWAADEVAASDTAILIRSQNDWDTIIDLLNKILLEVENDCEDGKFCTMSLMGGYFLIPEDLLQEQQELDLSKQVINVPANITLEFSSSNFMVWAFKSKRFSKQTAKDGIKPLRFNLGVGSKLNWVSQQQVYDQDGTESWCHYGRVDKDLGSEQWCKDNFILDRGRSNRGEKTALYTFASNHLLSGVKPQQNITIDYEQIRAYA